MHRALAHAPRVFRAWVDMAYALREQTTTQRHVRELVILRVLHVVGGDYELALHESMALSCGLTAEQVEAVRHWRDTDVFDGRQRALLAYADELVSADECRRRDLRRPRGALRRAGDRRAHPGGCVLFGRSDGHEGPEHPDRA